MTGWTHTAVIGQPGTWVLHRDGRELGTISLLDEAGTPTVRAGVMVAALNEFDAAMRTDDDARILVKGWRTVAAYWDDIELNRLRVDDQPPNIRAEIETAFRRAQFRSPLTPEQMKVWQATIDGIIASHDDEAAA